jgi:hypothetical protein
LVTGSITKVELVVKKQPCVTEGQRRDLSTRCAMLKGCNFHRNTDPDRGTRYWNPLTDHLILGDTRKPK